MLDCATSLVIELSTVLKVVVSPLIPQKSLWQVRKLIAALELAGNQGLTQ